MNIDYKGFVYKKSISQKIVERFSQSYKIKPTVLHHFQKKFNCWEAFSYLITQYCNSMWTSSKEILGVCAGIEKGCQIGSIQRITYQFVFVLSAQKLYCEIRWVRARFVLVDDNSSLAVGFLHFKENFWQANSCVPIRNVCFTFH